MAAVLSWETVSFTVRGWFQPPCSRHHEPDSV